LHKLIRLVGIKSDTLLNLQIVSDASYSWQFIVQKGGFTPKLKVIVKEDPKSFPDVIALCEKVNGVDQLDFC